MKNETFEFYSSVPPLNIIKTKVYYFVIELNTKRRI